MKHITLYAGLATLLTTLVGHGEVLNKSQIDQVIASKDASRVVGILPAIDQLWAANPKDYFESVKGAAGVLNATTNVTDRASIGVLFSNALNKPLPDDARQAVDCLNGGDDLVLSFLNFDEVRDSKAEWINIAKYVGKIRAQIDPTYVRKPVARNFVDPGEGLSAGQIEQRRMENDKNEAANRFQDMLRRADTILTFQLINNVKRFPASEPGHADFIESIATAAHLTDEEQHEIAN